MPSPNVVWIQTDEQRPDSLRCYGSEWAISPNIDRLAAGGTLFHECHVPSPLCVSCRAAVELCRYPQELGVYGNGPAFQDGVIDPKMKGFPNIFEDAGYRTASLGKWHTPNHPTFQDKRQFDLFHEVTGYFGLTPPYSHEEYEVVQAMGPMFHLILGGRYPHHDWGVTPSSHVTNQSIAWLADAAARPEPFLLRVSHLWPHTPVLVPEPWNRVYAEGQVPFKAPSRKLYDERSSYERWFADQLGGMELTDDEWRRATVDYYSLCAHVDHEVGRLLHALDELGLTDNTIIAFNADHGRSMGEMGLCQKGTYDREVWRVPFIFSYPGAVPAGVERTELVELMDFGPTLLGLAGLEMPAEFRGRNLFSPAAAGDALDEVCGVVDISQYRRAGIRRGKWRYDFTSQHHGAPTAADQADANLFDLEADPAEEQNLISDPSLADVAADLRARTLQWLESP